MHSKTQMYTAPENSPASEPVTSPDNGATSAKPSSSPDVQSALLAGLRKNRTPVTVFMVNGFQMTGTVKSFDAYCVIVECNGEMSMLYKHAISTITPRKPISWWRNGAAE